MKLNFTNHISRSIQYIQNTLMAKLYSKLSLAFTLCILFSTVQYGQLASGQENINYRIEIDALEWTQSSGADPTWQYYTRTSSAYTNACSNSFFDNATCKSYDDNSGPHDPGSLVASGTNVSQTSKAYATFISFDNSAFIGTDCEYDTGDSFGLCNKKTLSAKYSLPCTAHQNVSTHTHHKVTYKQEWRYNRGESRNSHLDFGDISIGEKTHTNSNRSSANSGLGYTNNYTSSSPEGNSSPDVFYRFEIPSNAVAKRVTITTENVSGRPAFDAYLHLERRFEPSGNIGYIAHDDDSGPSTLPYIQRDLCPGIYIVIVEGAGSRTGDFRVKINVADLPISSLNPGSIGANTTALCNGTDLPDMINTGFASSSITGLFGSETAYQGNEWWKRVGTNSNWTRVTGETGWGLTSTGSMMSQDVSFRRRTKYCGVWTEYTDPVTIPNNPGTVTAGSISFSGNSTVKEGDDPGQFNNVTSGTSTTGSLTYKWRKSEVSAGGPFVDVTPLQTGTSYNVGTLDETTWFIRQTIGGCSSNTANTDPIKITVIPADGIISGKVTAPPLGAGVGIGGVQVCATPINNPPPGSVQECTLTIDNPGQANHGTYEISGLYYGDQSTTFEVQATLAGHDICADENCDAISQTTQLVYQGITNRPNINFVDTTAYILSGNVYHNFDLDDDPTTADDKIGKSNVAIHVNGIPKGMTDAMGNYSVVIDNAGTWEIKPVFMNDDMTMEHTFVPAMQNVEVTQNATNIDFRDTNVNTLEGEITAGCDKYFGRVDVRVFQDAAVGTFNYTFQTNANSGSFNRSFPANEYKIEIKGDNILETTPIDYDWTDVYEPADVIAQLSTLAYSTDMNFQDTMIDAQYKAPVEIELVGIPSLDCGGSPFPNPVIEQGVAYPDFKIKIWEGPIPLNPIDGCLLDTGVVIVNDGIGDRGNGNIPVSDGEVDFLLRGGSPQIGGNHLKTLFITAKSLNPADQGKEKQLIALVTGDKQNDDFGITASPQIPVLILHDPPGDASFAEYSSEETFEVATRTYTKSVDEDNIWEKIKLGVDFGTEISVFGVGTSLQTEIWGQAGGDFTVTETEVSNEESILSLSRTDTYTTGDGLAFVGDQGDVFVGLAMKYKYSSATNLSLDENCQIKLDVSQIVDPIGIETTYILTTSEIEAEIEVYKGLIVTDPAKATFYQNQIDVWEQTIRQNRDRKAAAIQDPNLLLGTYTKGAGSTFTQETTSFTSQSSTYEFAMEIDTTITGEWKSEIAGNGSNGGVFFKFKTEIGKSETRDTLRRLTTSFTLADDDPGDVHTTRVYQDPVYKTPIFDLFSGRTSCPWEEGTTRRDNFEVVAETNTTQTGIAPNGQGIFQLRIFNYFNESRRFSLFSEAEYNPNGALINITTASGSGTTQAVNVQPNSSSLVTIDVSKLSSSPVFSYPNLKIKVVPECAIDGGNNTTPDDNLAQFMDLNAFFQTTCSDINIASPDPGRVVNIGDQNSLNIQFDDYDKNSLDRVILEYTKAGTGNWFGSGQIDLQSTDPDLSSLPTGTLVQWNTEELVDDGPYEIRFKVICGTVVNYSTLVPILVDRTKPVVFGIPAPVDDDYDQSENDEIYADFNELVRLSNPGLSNQAVLLDLITDEMLSATTAVFDNRVKITPNQILDNRAPSIYRVILNGIEDIHDNQADEYKWVFTVGEVDFEEAFCLNLLDIANNNENQDAINVNNYNAIAITSSGQIPNFGSTTYTAETQIDLTSGFEVQAGGVFLATIDMCDTPDPCGTIVSTVGVADAPNDYLSWDVTENSECITAITGVTGNPPNAAIEVDVLELVNSWNPSKVNVQLKMNVPGGSTTTIDVILDQDGISEYMGIYTALNGKSYKTTIDLTYDGERLVRATVTMVPDDGSGPTIAINEIAINDVIDAQEDDTPVYISGTTFFAETGQTITVGLNGMTYTGSVIHGRWTVTVPVEDVQALPVSGTINVTADVDDLAGNSANQATRTFSRDDSTPTTMIDIVSTSPYGDPPNSPTFESIQNLTDGDIFSKWLNFNGDLQIVLDLGVATAVNTIDVTTANDAPGRDPTVLVIAGSNDGTTFTTIVDTNMDCITDRRFTRSYGFDNSDSYQYYRIQFLNKCDYAANSMQLAEIALWGN